MLRFLNLRSLFHIINVLPFFVFTPFTIVVLAPGYGTVSTLAFYISMFALVINNHFFTMYIKRKSINSSWWFFSIIALIAFLKALDHFHLLSFEKASSAMFTALLQYPWLSVLPVGLAVGTFLVNNHYLRNHLYIEELVRRRKLAVRREYSFLNRYGGVGEMIALDLKLIFRNKRPRSLVILSVIILLYGFIFYPRYIASGSDSMLFMFALIINGIFIGNYGQFLFAWQSSHFDGMMSFNLNMEQYIRAKFALFLTVGTLQFLVMCLYGLMSWRLLPIQSAAFLYSIGVNSFVTIYAATFNYKYLDLRRSASFNFQGIGAAQWLQSLLIMFAPALLFYVLNRFFGFWIATVCISFIGMTGLALNGMIINWLAGEFNLRKHKILEGFRER